MTAIIILNWNGADDTIACLSSLAKAEGDFFVVLVDNASTDDSLSRISACSDGLPYQLHILPQTSNLGFAKGNNVGMAFAATLHPDDYMLLNNDTEVNPDFLVRLKRFSTRHPEYRVLTPKINYYDRKDVIWNCGGRLFFGFRKYYCADKKDSEVAAFLNREFIRIGFVTGCALWFHPDIIGTDGRLLTERYFFGEEDFEFSLRMRNGGIPMACVISSQIYHKVGSSGKSMRALGKLYVHLLNRYTDVRLTFPPVMSFVWRCVNVPVSFRHFLRESGSASESLRLLLALTRDSRGRSGVSYEDFKRIVIDNRLNC